MKKPNYVVVFVIVLILVYLFVIVSAKADVEQEAQSTTLHLIEKLDLDKDGEISIKEAVASPAVLAAFGKIDTDGNGKLSRFELIHVKYPSVVQLKSSQRD
jgi:energy-converting hydrogenase Eha subunit H